MSDQMRLKDEKEIQDKDLDTVSGGTRKEEEAGQAHSISPELAKAHETGHGIDPAGGHLK